MSQLVDFCTSATERLLLLLGWDRSHTPAEAYSTGEKKSKGTLRMRKGRSVNRPSKPGWEKDVKLAPVPHVSTTYENANSSQNAWTADAFDTAVTGTV